MRRTTRLLVLVLALAMVAAACGDDDGAATTTTTAPTDEAPPTESATPPDEVDDPEGTLRILASNDDGIAHPGLDLMVRHLQELHDVEITVVAPAVNMSGSGDNTTPGGAPYEAAETAGGTEGTAVDGFPADAVLIALDELGLEPHLVVSGINDAHNIGPFVPISGTVGVARTAIRRGIPGVAVSAGTEYVEAEFEIGARLVVDWITEHRGALLDGSQPTDFAVSFNIPACPPEQMGDLVEVPIADAFPEGVNPFESTCDLADPDPADDYTAVASGYPTMTTVPPEL